MARLNLNWPGQQITTPTADEWFGLDPANPAKGTGPLADFPAAEVWEAIDRCRRDLRPGPDGRPRGAWLPNLADILAAIDSNWREAARADLELKARAVKAERNSRGGRPPPPETKEAQRLLEDAKRLPGTPGYLPLSVARERIDVLWEQLNQRQEREQAGQLA